MIEFAVESFRDTAKEVYPLFLEHNAEINMEQYGAKFQPNWEWLYFFEDQKLMVWVTARNDQKELVGYSMYLVAPSYWHENLIQAQNDAYYLLKKYRRGHTIKRMFRFAEAELKKLGVGVIVCGSWNSNRAARLLEYFGYEAKKEVLMKILR